MKDNLFGFTLSSIAIWVLTYEQLNQFFTILIAILTSVWLIIKIYKALTENK